MAAARGTPGTWLRAAAAAFAGLALGAATIAPAAAAPPAAAAEPLRIVGGLAGLNQFTRHEEPFWTRELARLSGGRHRAEIVPFDRAGLRGQDMLSLVQMGSVPFATALLSMVSTRDTELAAPDLAGLNPDMASLRRTVAALRPTLRTLLRERHGVELLAVYTYPAQVLFCKQGWQRLADLRGRRIRTASVSQADWVEALGAKAVAVPFAELPLHLRAGNIDCAITGTMSGHTAGLHEFTTHVHAMAVNWGLAVFVANEGAWHELPDDLRTLLQRELPRLERTIWDEAERETRAGIACNVGAASCREARPGHMVEVGIHPDDERRRRDILVGTVLPRWAERCGADCARRWNRSVGAALGLELAAP